MLWPGVHAGLGIYFHLMGYSGLKSIFWVEGIFGVEVYFGLSYTVE